MLSLWWHRSLGFFIITGIGSLVLSVNTYQKSSCYGLQLCCHCKIYKQFQGVLRVAFGLWKWRLRIHKYCCRS